MKQSAIAAARWRFRDDIARVFNIELQIGVFKSMMTGRRGGNERDDAGLRLSWLRAEYVELRFAASADDRLRGRSMHALGHDARGEVFDRARPALRVLVIDDDDCVGAAIKTILSHRRSDTRVALRAFAGIASLESSLFDLVLIDLFMPGMSGLEAITYIRRQSDIPIVAMSGLRLRDPLNSVDYLRMAMERGASTSIRKPFTPQQLIEAIDHSLILASSGKEPTQ